LNHCIERHARAMSFKVRTKQLEGQYGFAQPQIEDSTQNPEKKQTPNLLLRLLSAIPGSGLVEFLFSLVYRIIFRLIALLFSLLKGVCFVFSGGSMYANRDFLYSGERGISKLDLKPK
jgi:hypothetical protein